MATVGVKELTVIVFTVSFKFNWWSHCWWLSSLYVSNSCVCGICWQFSQSTGSTVTAPPTAGTGTAAAAADEVDDDEWD